MEDDEILTNLVTELKRGNLTLSVLSQLKTPQYGYSLLQILSEKQIAIEANTLYPLLRRLETQGLLESTWNTAEPRPRKFYRLNERGNALYEALKSAWTEQYERIRVLMEEEEHA
ncbi:MAG: PadR family transcriptional regulator [Sphaerochaeta sp.]|uniref:PadR family transcriptional regulator n=1 Tax=Sphaerochaeta sp. TaxID=1972642 RepID=UPI002FCB98F6